MSTFFDNFVLKCFHTQNYYIIFFIFFRNKSLTVNEALDLLELDNVQYLYIEPPDVQNLTDEDSGAEDDETVFHPESLSGNQLLAPVVFRVCRDDYPGEEEQGADEEEHEIIAVQHKTKRQSDIKFFN